MPISYTIDRAKDLTLFTATDDVTYDDALTALGAYTKEGYTRFELFDFRNGTGRSFSTEQIELMLEMGKTNVGLRPAGGKTALVVSQDIDYGLSRVFQTLSEIEGITWEVEVFRSMDEAYEWLGISQDLSEG